MGQLSGVVVISTLVLPSSYTVREMQIAALSLAKQIRLVCLSLVDALMGATGAGAVLAQPARRTREPTMAHRRRDRFTLTLTFFF